MRGCTHLIEAEAAEQAGQLAELLGSPGNNKSQLTEVTFDLTSAHPEHFVGFQILLHLWSQFIVTKF